MPSTLILTLLCLWAGVPERGNGNTHPRPSIFLLENSLTLILRRRSPFPNVCDMFYLLRVRVEKDLYKMGLYIGCTIHERVRKLLVITPHHTVPSLIPTMRYVGHFFRLQKIINACKITAEYLSFSSVVICGAGLQW